MWNESDPSFLEAFPSYPAKLILSIEGKTQPGNPNIYYREYLFYFLWENILEMLF